MDDFAQQVQDAIAFLKKYQSDLGELQEFIGDKNVYLDFGVESRNVFVQSERVPPELLRLAGDLDIAIEISRYCQ